MHLNCLLCFFVSDSLFLLWHIFKKFFFTFHFVPHIFLQNATMLAATRERHESGLTHSVPSQKQTP